MERPSALQRLRAALFASPLDGLITVVLLAALLAGGQALLHWLVFKAQWAVIQVNSTLFAVGRYPLDQQWRLWLLTTLLAGATGLSWGLLRALPRPDRRAVLWPTNDRLAVALLSGLGVLVPLVLQLSAAIALRWWLITALLMACRWLAGRWGAALPAIARRGWPLIWPLLYLLGMTLIAGGFGVPAVSPYRWGGLLLTLIEACFAILLCFPLGVLLALG
ncbi:MAG: amino acid ABC transporter permease, partial [Synechococcus sp.]